MDPAAPLERSRTDASREGRADSGCFSVPTWPGSLLRLLAERGLVRPGESSPDGPPRRSAFEERVVDLALRGGVQRLAQRIVGGGIGGHARARRALLGRRRGIGEDALVVVDASACSRNVGGVTRGNPKRRTTIAVESAVKTTAARKTNPPRLR